VSIALGGASSKLRDNQATTETSSGESDKTSSPASAVGLFPFNTRQGWNNENITEKGLMDSILDYVDMEPNLSLRYSYYSNDERGVNPTKVWAGSFVHKTPALSNVVSTARRLELDYVIMVWFQTVRVSRSWDLAPVEFHVIDTGSEQLTTRKGQASNRDDLIGIVFDSALGS